MSSIEELRAALLRFRDERDWQQFHTLRNLIVSLNLEAGELLEDGQAGGIVRQQLQAGVPPVGDAVIDELADGGAGCHADTHGLARRGADQAAGADQQPDGATVGLGRGPEAAGLGRQAQGRQGDQGRAGEGAQGGAGGWRRNWGWRMRMRT